MLKDFENIVNISLSLGAVIESLFVALICSIIIAFIYRITYKGPGFSLSFIHSLIALSMITSIVIMVIGNNLARAFGLVGAMSIIRFRTPIKDAMDIVYIFFALAIGMAAGVGLHLVAFWGTIFIGFVIYALSKTNFLSVKKQKYLLQFSFSSAISTEESPYLSVIKKFCRKYNLINIQDTGIENQLELSYYVDLRDKNLSKEFLRELKLVDGISKINLYHDDESF